jgi:hypothetical protein
VRVPGAAVVLPERLADPDRLGRKAGDCGVGRREEKEAAGAEEEGAGERLAILAGHRR